jgi:hypothetical protein
MVAKCQGLSVRLPKPIYNPVVCDRVKSPDFTFAFFPLFKGIFKSAVTAECSTPSVLKEVMRCRSNMLFQNSAAAPDLVWSASTQALQAS